MLCFSLFLLELEEKKTEKRGPKRAALSQIVQIFVNGLFMLVQPSDDENQTDKNGDGDRIRDQDHQDGSKHGEKHVGYSLPSAINLSAFWSHCTVKGEKCQVWE